MVTKEKDEELALFLEMRRREKKEKNNLLLLHNSDGLDAPLGTNPRDSPISKIVSSIPPRKTAAEKFLDSENDKSDYDWLLTPPGTPLFPSLEMESQKTLMSEIGLSNARPSALKLRLTNIQEEPSSRTIAASKHTTLQSGVNSSSTCNRRPSSSGRPTSATRPATPTGRPTLPTMAKPSRPSTPTSRATLPSTKPAAPSVRSSTPSRIASRSSTPTARKPAAPLVRPSTPSRTSARSSTPTALKPAAPPVRPSTPSRTSARSSTPTARHSVPASKSTSRSATPTRQPSTPLGAPSAAAPPGRSSSVTKSVSTVLKNPMPSRGSSPTAKSRPWKPNEMLGFSLDAPPNLRTSMPERPASASRGRPGSSSSRSSSVESGSKGKPRQQSCSPSRGRVSNSTASGSRISIPTKTRAQKNDDVNPVLMGTKMVERVVNMRKLAPPKQDDLHFGHNNSAGKFSLDSTGFGRTLSKKSLDMALRHMDIRRSVNGSLRPLMTNIPASSVYSVRSGGSTRSRTVSVSDSPLATSSNASSELSVNNNSCFLDGIDIDDNNSSSEPSVNNISYFVNGIDMEHNEFGSERGNSSPVSQHGR